MVATGAFFDFDRTLIDVESPRLGIRHLRERGQMPASYLIRAAAASILYRHGLMSDAAMARILISFYRGRPSAPFEEGAHDYYLEVIRPHLAGAIVRRLEWHQAEGHVSVLVSAGLRYLLEPVAADLGIDRILCTDLEKGPDGVFTGRTLGPVCTEGVKRRLVEGLAEEAGIDLAVSYAYGNHEADIPMLELVGRPFAVEPTDSLRKHSLKRGWPILTYR